MPVRLALLSVQCFVLFLSNINSIIFLYTWCKVLTKSEEVIAFKNCYHHPLSMILPSSKLSFIFSGICFSYHLSFDF